MTFRVLYCGARCGVVLSSLARFGAIMAWSGTVRSCPAWRRMVRQAVIDVWRGRVLHCGVESGPVGRCEVLPCSVLLRCGVVRLGHVRFGSVLCGGLWRFLVRSGCAGWSTGERGFVWRGKVLSWFGEVRFCCVGLGGVWLAKLLLWSGEVLFGSAGQRGARYSEVLLWIGKVKRGFVRCSRAECALAFLGQARRCPVRFGLVMSGLVTRGMARFSRVFGNVRLQK